MKITNTTDRNCRVQGVRLYDMRLVQDPARGHLTVGEFGRDMPFVPQRYFVTFAVPSLQVRGEHAHHQCAQFMVCVSGECSLAVDDGIRREEFRLDRPNLGVYVPPLIWAAEFKHTADSALLVFASRSYEPEDYIRDYSTFLALVESKKRPS